MDDFTGLCHQRSACDNLFGTAVDQALDFLGRRRCATSQTAHFTGHYGKAATLLASARSLHGGVEGQNIGLEGNAVNDADDVRNPARAGTDIVHALHHFVNHLATACRGIRRCRRQLIGVAGRISAVLHRAIEVLQTAGGHL